MSKSFNRAIVSACILLTSVYTPMGQASDSELPSWYTAPPVDNSSTMWGVGEGSDLELAKRSALKDIAAKLRVAISAKIESQTTVNQNSVDRYARTRLFEDVQRTEFKNHKLEKSTRAGQYFYALVSVDRRVFIADAEQKLTAAEREIDTLLNGSKNANSIEKFISQQKALPWLEKAVVSSQLLSAADPGFDGSRLSRHETALSKAKTAAGELTFDIKAKGDSLDVANTLRNFLNEAGMRTGNNGTSLIVSTSAAQSTIFGAHKVQLRVSLSVLDSQKRNFSSKEFTTHGSSVTSHQMARQAALRDLGEKLREAGPLVALGFKQEE
jgi:hypothetical protein